MGVVNSHRVRHWQLWDKEQGAGQACPTGKHTVGCAPMANIGSPMPFMQPTGVAAEQPSYAY